MAMANGHEHSWCDLESGQCLQRQKVFGGLVYILTALHVCEGAYKVPDLFCLLSNSH